MLAKNYFLNVTTAFGFALGTFIPLNANASSFVIEPGATGAIADALETGGFSITNFRTLVSNLTSNTVLVKLSLNLSHANLADLEIYLTSPTGKTLNIAAGFGDFSGNINATLLDGSEPAIDTVLSSSISGNYTPSGSQFVTALTPNITTFAGFNGFNPNGEWKLSIADLNFTNTGSLNSAVLDIEIQPIPFEFSPVMGIAMLGGFGLYQKWRKGKIS